MDVREKLVEILGEFLLWPSKMKNVWMPQGIEKLADHLISNGVTVQDRGNWKYYHKQNKAVCTNCSFERDLDANFGKAIACPNCGARMDLEALQ